jgi:hypothetical protein
LLARYVYLDRDCNLASPDAIARSSVVPSSPIISSTSLQLGLLVEVKSAASLLVTAESQKILFFETSCFLWDLSCLDTLLHYSSHPQQQLTRAAQSISNDLGVDCVSIWELIGLHCSFPPLAAIITRPNSR